MNNATVKRVGLMQPYFFPYLGYFQLIQATDEFILYDDAQYMKGGWVNRNRLGHTNGVNYFTLPIARTGHREPIFQKTINSLEYPKFVKRFKGQLQAGYRKAPQYEGVLELVTTIVDSPERNLAGYLYQSIDSVCRYIGIETPLCLASDIALDDPSSSGAGRVIDICRSRGATDYYNAIGGVSLYDKSEFESQGIRLAFVSSNSIAYPQGQQDFVPDLSIIDALMYNSVEDVRALLTEYSLV